MSLEEAATLTGDVVMKDNTRAFTLEFTEDTGSLTINPVGEIDSGQMEYTLTLVKARLAKRVLGFMNAALGRKMFFIVQDENGVYYLMGNRRRGCTFVTGGDGATTGTTSGDRNQASLQFKFRAGRAFVYEGDVEDILEIQATCFLCFVWKTRTLGSAGFFVLFPCGFPCEFCMKLFNNSMENSKKNNYQMDQFPQTGFPKQVHTCFGNQVTGRTFSNIRKAWAPVIRGSTGY
jgi:hypothetical protein